jgi:hypothetical protein
MAIGRTTIRRTSKRRTSKRRTSKGCRDQCYKIRSTFCRIRHFVIRCYDVRHCKIWRFVVERIVVWRIVVWQIVVWHCTTYTPGLPDGLFSNQKSQIWVNFGGPFNGKSWYVLWPFVIFYGHCVYFTAFWSSLWSFGIFFPIWNVWTKKNLATLLHTLMSPVSELLPIILSYMVWQDLKWAQLTVCK